MGRAVVQQPGGQRIGMSTARSRGARPCQQLIVRTSCSSWPTMSAVGTGPATGEHPDSADRQARRGGHPLHQLHGRIRVLSDEDGDPDRPSVGPINLVTNDPEDAAEVVDELIAHPAVRRISFTGSTRVGRIIAQKAARHLKRVLLELGGNAPLVVLADADLDRAVAAANFGSFMNQGQICMSTERIVIDRSVADEFAQMLGERAGALKVGDPREPDTQIGPVVNQDALKRVTEHVEDAVAKGATVIAGGTAKGRYFEPTVVMGVTPDMRMYHEESFGPVVAIVPVDGVEEAVRVANDTEYGLSSAVFSQDVDTAMDVALRLDTGICHINDTTVNDEPPMPFGGVKGQRLGPIRRQGGARGIHRASLDHNPGQPAHVPDLAAPSPSSIRTAPLAAVTGQISTGDGRPLPDSMNGKGSRSRRAPRCP
jgi:hypothetical protein